MGQQSHQQPALLSDQLSGFGRRCFPHCRVPEPRWDAHRRGRGVAGLHGLGLGRREQNDHQQLQEEQSHGLRRRRHGRQLRIDLHAGQRHGFHVSNHFTSGFDIRSRFLSPPQHEEQAGEQDGGCRTEEVADGNLPGSSGPAGGEHPEDPELHGGKTEVMNGLLKKLTTKLWPKIMTVFFLDGTDLSISECKPVTDSHAECF